MRSTIMLITAASLLLLIAPPDSVVSQDRYFTQPPRTVSPAFGTPQNVGLPVNTGEDENSPFLAPNGLSLYFSGARAGGFGSGDIWVSQRPTLTSAWGPPQNLGPVINTSSSDNTPSISPDGRTMFFNSDKPGGIGGQDIYMTTRSDPNDNFGWGPPQNLGPVINTQINEGGTSYFEDAATGIGTLYFIAIREGGMGDYDIYQSIRSNDGSFGQPTNVTPLNSAVRDARPAVRRDGLEMFLASERSGSNDIYVSTRASVNAPWNPPVSIAAINSAANDGAPAISPDGAVLYFSSFRSGGSGSADLYAAARISRSVCSCSDQP